MFFARKPVTKVILSDFISMWGRGVLHKVFWYFGKFWLRRPKSRWDDKWILKSRMLRRAMNMVCYRDKNMALVNKVVPMKLSLHAGNSMTGLKI